VKTVIAVILILNGVQIPLPQPAILADGAAWVPLRTVCQQLGWKVGWDSSQQAIQLKAPGHLPVLMQVGQRQMKIGGLTFQSPQAPRRIGSLIYVPAQLLTIVIQAELDWDNQNKTLYINAPPVGKPEATTISDIVSDPPGWANKVVTIMGEYTGWQADPFNLATSHGPPVTRSDWTLRDETGCLYCTGGRADAPLSLKPYSDLGRRLQVTGAVQVAHTGFPYLQVQKVAPLTGLAGITCYLTTDRRQYEPGETVVMQMKVANPTAQPVTLQFTSSKTYDFAVCDQSGQQVWRWSAGRVFAQVLTDKVLEPAHSYTVEAWWTIPTDDSEMRPGLYQVTGEITQDVKAYPHTIQIAAQG